MDFKPALVLNLKRLYQQEKVEKNHFKAKAYATVLSQVESLTTPVLSIQDLSGLKGIGKSISSKLEEIFSTGTTLAIDPSKIKSMEAIEQLSNVMNIGPVKAKELVEKHGIDSIEKLQKEGLQYLNDKQLMGLRYYEDIKERIPLDEMKKHDAYLDSIIDTTAGIRWQMTGSYRRQRPNSGDIDILITSPFENPLHSIVHMLQDIGYVKAIFALGEKKMMAMCRLPRHKRFRRIDLLYTTPKQFPFALLYFTGSQNLNIQMRQHALGLGYSLNEYGLTPTDTCTPAAREMLANAAFDSEADIFAFLGLEYVEPVDREKVVIKPLKN